MKGSYSDKGLEDRSIILPIPYAAFDLTSIEGSSTIAMTNVFSNSSGFCSIMEPIIPAISARPPIAIALTSDDLLFYKSQYVFSNLIYR